MKCTVGPYLYTITLVTSNVVSLQYEGLSFPLLVDGLEKVASTCRELAYMVSVYMHLGCLCAVRLIHLVSACTCVPLYF